MENKPNRIIWHHTADISTGPQANKINRWHAKKGFTKSALGFYGGYHILIEKDGLVFRYRNDEEQGCHVANQNKDTLGLGLAGNFSVELPTKEQEKSIHEVLTNWMSRWNIQESNILPHRALAATECPGKLLANDWIVKLLYKKISNETIDILTDVIKYIQSKFKT